MPHINYIYRKEIITPAGVMILASYRDKLCLCDWKNGQHVEHKEERLRKGLDAELTDGDSTVIAQAEQEIGEYFSGKRKSFSIPLLFVGTDFQKRVWEKLLEIPYGQTISYGEMAAQLGCPKAARAVANANGANGISIIAPCHRVIGSDGSLTGYAGGIGIKETLLRLEGALMI